MSDWVVKLLVALIGLIGTLTVAYIGYRQWRLSRKDSAHQDVAKAKRQAYETLWKLVERIHIDLRKNPEEIQHLPERIAEVNSYVLENEPYLADGDHALVNQYIEALGEMVSWVRSQGDPAARMSLPITAEIPREAFAVARAFAIRDQLLERVRKALE